MPRKVAAEPAFDDGVSVQVTLTLPQCPRRRATKQDGKSRPAESKPALPRIPRVTRLMALAIKFQDMVDRGEVRDYADLARLGYVTRARMTQIMNLLLLAPDIQEALLSADDVAAAPAGLAERHLRVAAKCVLWSGQRKVWSERRMR